MLRARRSASGLLRQASRIMILTPLARSSGGAHVVDRDHLVAQADFVLQFRVGRHQVVLALILHGVAGVEEQRRVGVRHLPRELLHGLVQRPLVGIRRQHDVKSEGAERRRDILGVVLRVGEGQVGILVVGISDHQSDAAFRERRVGGEGHDQHGRNEGQCRDEEIEHDPPACRVISRPKDGTCPLFSRPG